MDIPPDAVNLYPELYAMCIDNEYFTVLINVPSIRYFFPQPWLFWGWIIHAIIESLICAYTPSLYLRNASPETGTYDTFWQSGAMTFTIVVIVVNMKVLGDQKTSNNFPFQMMFVQTQWMPIHFFVITVSIASWFAIAYIITSVDVLDYEWHEVQYRL